MRPVTKQPKEETETPNCVGDHGNCPNAVLAKGRCQAHYRRFLRGGSDTAPVLHHRGELVPLSLRVTESAAAELERAGGGYKVGAAVLEDWAKEQAFLRDRSAPVTTIATKRRKAN